MRRFELSRWMLGVALAGSMAMSGQVPAPAVPAPLVPAAAAQANPGARVETSVPDISELLRKAAQAIQQGQFPAAEGALDGARAVNPTQLGLWSLYGDLNGRRGDSATAETDYRKEIELHPEFFAVYRSLAVLEIQKKQFDEATATLHRWEAAEPDNSGPLSLELNMLLQEGKYAEAAKIGEDAATHVPADVRGDPEVQFLLGTAEMKAGHRDKAVPLLEGALQTNDLVLKNSAAYTLADANADLPLAQAVQRSVLERMGLTTEGWTLSENILNLLADTQAFAAEWDTMGWILFREGKLPEAESYVRAAWRNAPHAGIGEHLGEIEAARGNHRAALESYQLALAAALMATNGAGSASNAEDVALLKKRIAAEEKAGVRPTLTDPDAELAKTRVFRLGPAGGRNGTAQYRVLFGRGKVVRSETALKNGKTIAGAAQVIARANVADFFPGESYSQLVHVGMLNCNGSTCEFVMQE